MHGHVKVKQIGDVWTIKFYVYIFVIPPKGEWNSQLQESAALCLGECMLHSFSKDIPWDPKWP